MRQNFNRHLLKSIFVLLCCLGLVEVAKAQTVPDASAPSPEANAETPISPSSGRIRIVLDYPPSPETRFPIAVPNLVWTGSGEDHDQLGVKIAEILKNDLKIAGYFKVLENANQPADASQPTFTADQIPFDSWKNIGARGLVKGSLKLDGKEAVIELRLFDPETKEMLVGKEYRAPRKNFRQAIHRFMDEIMLSLTGERGIFSTQIVAACGPVGKREIYKMDIDGENRVALTKNKSINVSVDSSHDGKKIAFTSYSKHFPEIFVANTDGKGKPTRVTFTNAMNITPAFSPDGSTLAISSSFTGDPEIHLIDISGKHLAQLTHQAGIDIAPSWSPDGQALVFASERSGNLHLFSMDRSGNGTKRLTFEGYQNDQPDWSPKGNKIAFARRDGGVFAIYNINPDGSGAERISRGSTSDESPSYSPDGRYIVFSRNQNYRSDLHIMLWEGSNAVPITQTGDCVNPDWMNRE